MTTNFDLRRVMQIVRRRLWILVLCVVLVPGAAIAVSMLLQKEYTAKAFLLFRDPQFDQKLFGSTFVPNSADPQRQAATNLEIISLETVAARTAKRVPGITPKQVSDAVKPKSEGQADVVSINATWTDPRRAATLADAYAHEYIGFRRNADRAKIEAAQAPLRRQLASLTQNEREGPTGQALRTRLTQLDVLASLQTGNAELLQNAQIPEGPSSPEIVRNGILGLMLGLILGGGLIGLAEALDRRVRDPSEIEHAFNVPVLANVTESSWLEKADPALSDVPQAQREAFHMLRANLRYFSVSRDIDSLLVTSAEPGEGKSTVAWGLAVAAASMGTNTLLVEADLRSPSFASRFGLDTRGGLTAVLTGHLQPGQALQSIPLPHAVDDPSPPRALHVLLAGSIPPNPTDLVESGQMAEMLDEVERHYDLVIVDTPPIGIVPDAIPLMRRVGGVIVVSRLGTSSRGPMHRLAAQLENLDAPVLGVVVNSADRGGEYAYGYSYGDGHRQPPRGTPAPATPRRSDPTPDGAAHRDDASDATGRMEPEQPPGAKAASAAGKAADGRTAVEMSTAGRPLHRNAPAQSPAERRRFRDLLR